jgi:hypothetical protein
MGGGLMQIVAYGAQDVYLTGSPQITYFKVVYRRHTNFSAENIEHALTNANFSNSAHVVVTRNADLITQVYLKVKLPQISVSSEFAAANQDARFGWVRKVGHALIEHCNVDIGGTTMDKQYSDWLNIWQELTLSAGQQRNYAKMIGDTQELTRMDAPRADGTIKDETTLYVPMQFWFCRNNGLALPLIALQYHEVRLSFKFRSFEDCCIINGAMGSTKNLVRGASSGSSSLDAYVAVEYIYLDSDERRRFAQVGHEYLIEQTQFSNDVTVGTSTVSQQMFFNHPTKMIVWALKSGAYQGGNFLAYSETADWSAALSQAAKVLLQSQLQMSATGAVTVYAGEDAPADVAGYEVVPCNILNPAAPHQMQAGKVYRRIATSPLLATSTEDLGSRALVDCTHFTAVIAGTQPVAGTPVPVQVASIVPAISVNKLDLVHLSRPLQKYTTDARPAYMKRQDVTVFQHHNYGLLIDGSVNPVVKGNIKLNGHDRFAEKDGAYFNYVQPYQCLENSPADGINTFSFGVKPAQHQPGGACNLSRIDTAQLNMSLDSGKASSRITSQIRSELLGIGASGSALQNTRLVIFAFSYNVLRIMSGMGGLAYAN